jgi:hypothetical protein
VLISVFDVDVSIKLKSYEFLHTFVSYFLKQLDCLKIR